MSSLSNWLLSLLVTALFSAALTGYSDRSSERTFGIRPSRKGITEDDGQDNPYNYESSSDTDPDMYLLHLFSQRTKLEPLTNLYKTKASQEPKPLLRPWPESNYQTLSESIDDPPEQISKREGHSLSIVNPLDVLRQRMMLEMARRRMKENQDQIKANDVILKTLGKRARLGDSEDDEDGDSASNKQNGTDERRRQNYRDRTQNTLSDEFSV